ncbi:MAG: metallophosphoesterase [Lentisphaeria bacterium]|nr:metallophosphoesterase [Lentisphaeria bacterium]
MKRFFTAVLTLCCLVLFASEYNFIALGDIHYDNAKYHKAKSLTSGKQSERKRNNDMWANGKSDAVLTAAAAQAKSSKSVFVVQLGDFTQGDCDTAELQEQMFSDAFTKVKSFFPEHKLLAVKGNHDVHVRGVKGYCNTPSEKVFMPLIAKELGRENFSGSYTVRQGKDLFIFFDNFYKAKVGIDFVKKALNDNKDARYVFFLTHIPVLPCSLSVPEWLVQGDRIIADMLTKRNAIILTAHTHYPSFMSVSDKNGTLSQLVVCSMGSQWAPQKSPYIKMKTFEDFKKASLNHKKTNPKRAGFFKKFETYTVNQFNFFSWHSGFVVIKVDDNGVFADVHTGNSGKPWTTITLLKNAKNGK